MQIMQGTTLKDLDETDSDTLLGFYFWYANRNTESNQTDSKSKNIVYRDGKPYRVIKAGQSEWTDKIF